MSNRPPQRTRHLFPFKKVTSVTSRGQYARSLHAARLAREGDTAVPQTDQRVARWVFVLAFMPVLLVALVGGYALNLAMHTQRAVQKVSGPSIAAIVHATDVPSLPPDGVAPQAIVATPNAQATGAPLTPTTHPTPVSLPPPDFARKDPFTVMLLGVEDQRNGPDDASRSDTIILAYVDPLAKHVNLLSIPRDLWVTQPGGRGLAKMADVYANGDALKYKGVGGVAFVWDTIEQNFQIKIDYYGRANFDGFTKIVDTVGGVTVDNPYPIKDDSYPTPDFQYARVFFPAGIVHLDGAEALKYVRMRHDDSDFGRNMRQQQVILSIREQAQRLNLLSKSTDLIDALGDTFRTDLPTDQWLGMARFGIGLPQDAFHQFTLTDLLSETTINGIFYLTVDWSKAGGRAAEFSPKENTRVLRAAAPGTAAGRGTTVAGNNRTRDTHTSLGDSLLIVGLVRRRHLPDR